MSQLTTQQLCLVLVICSAFSAVGDYATKKYVLSDNTMWLAVLFAAWTVTTVFWVRLVKMTETLATASKLWTVMYTAMMLFVSQIVFKEAITGRQWVGIALGFISLLLML